MSVKDVLIIGAGPAGLATAISAKQRGLDYLVLEKGVLVNSIYGFPSNMSRSSIRSAIYFEYLIFITLQATDYRLRATGCRS